MTTGARMASMGVLQALEPPPTSAPADEGASIDVMVDAIAAKENLNPEEKRALKTEAGGQIDADRVGYGMWRNPNLFKDPSFLNRAGKIFLKAGMGETGMRWLERGAKAVDERGIDALRLLIGGDPKGAEEAFNSAGTTRIQPGSLREAGNGRWSMTLADGKEHTFEPRQLLRSYLNPRDFFNLELNEGRAASQDQQRRDSAGARDRELTERERHNRVTEGIQRQIANFRTERGPEAATALERNIRFLVDNKIAKDPAEAFSKLRTAMEKPEEDAILAVAGNLMKGVQYRGKGGWDKAVKDATTMVQTVKGSKPAPAPAAGGRAPAAGAPAPSAPAPGAGTYSVGGKSFTDADIESTARMYGLTADQVKQRLGIR